MVKMSFFFFNKICDIATPSKVERGFSVGMSVFWLHDSSRKFLRILYNFLHKGSAQYCKKIDKAQF